VRPAATTDGVAIRFDANVELSDDLDVALANGAEGIGLFRSEFMLGGLPVDALNEEAQYGAYRVLVERMAPQPVTVRTFDVDSTRLAAHAPDWAAGTSGSETSNGALGLRAIRLTLAHPDLFATQLRALVRAARHGTLRILFPFVSSVDELRQARAALSTACEAVGSASSSGIQIGAMIEVPSAAMTVDLLATEVDFFSIGTNDLVQYCLAVDRTDGRVAALYDPLHPAVLRVIRGVVRAAARHRKPVAVCGEMTSDPAALLALVGLGITHFSMGPAQIPTARSIVSEVAMADVRRVVGRALRLSTGREIASYLAEAFPALVRPGHGRAMKEGAEGAHGEH
jgi:phosphotransferase system enzyme I (PtsI)